jgi:hypothetical protein
VSDPLTEAREALETAEHSPRCAALRVACPDGWVCVCGIPALAGHLRAALAESTRLAAELARVTGERDGAKAGAASERERTHRMSLACEWCRAKGYGEGGGSPCPLHGGAEEGAIGKDGAGRMFFYCPNCSQRTSDGTKHRYRAEAENERLRAEVARLSALLSPTISTTPGDAVMGGGRKA